VKLTVAICTWNRAHILDKALAKMLELELPVHCQWELVIVNNNCTDNTDSVIGSYEQKLPISRLFEKNHGLSNARNCAIAASSGDYIVWTDDDVLVDRYWLAAYAAAFARWPDAVLFGGTIKPWFEGEPPSWLLSAWSSVSGAYATRELGTDSFMLTTHGNQLPYGANFAIRRDVQDRYLYDPNFGLNHGKIVLGEESLVFLNVINNGGTGWWVPDAQVSHLITKDRQSLKYIRNYYVGLGRTLRRKSGCEYGPGLFDRPLWLWRKAVEAELNYRYHRMVTVPEIWVKDLRQASTYWGQILTD
jgi:glucosyl-dolichyl phosphate glucuronosyltransferase